MFTFLLVVHAIISAALVAVILMQRSEGGGLGMGGSPSGLMSARGAADFLTRATTILASIFVILSIGLAALATIQHAPTKIDESLAPAAVPSTSGLLPGAPAPGGADPLSAAAAGAAGTANPPAQAPASMIPSTTVPATTVPAAAAKAPATTPRPATPAPARTPAAASSSATIPTVTAPPPLATTPPANGSGQQ